MLVQYILRSTIRDAHEGISKITTHVENDEESQPRINQNRSPVHFSPHRGNDINHKRIKTTRPKSHSKPANPIHIHFASLDVSLDEPDNPIWLPSKSVGGTIAAIVRASELHRACDQYPEPVRDGDGLSQPPRERGSIPNESLQA